MSNIADIESFLAAYSGEVKDVPPDQFIPYVQILTDGLVGSIKEEHTTAGAHNFAYGNLADRPTAANAMWYVTTDETGGPKLYFSDGGSWSNMTDINSTNLPFTHAGFPALTKISSTLTYILGAMQNSGNYVLGSKVLTSLTNPQVLGASDTVDNQLALIDTKLNSFDPTKISLPWGTANKTLRQMSIDVKASLDAIAGTGGAAATGFTYDATMRHILNTDTTVWAAIKRLDSKMFHEGFDTNSSSLFHTPQGSKFFGDATAVALQAVLNMIENALTRMPIAHAIGGSYIGTLTWAGAGIANKQLIDIFQFPELASTGGLGTVGVDNVYVDNFAARAMTYGTDASNLMVDFRDDDNTVDATVTIPSGSNEAYARGAADVITWSNDLDFFTVYAYPDTDHTGGNTANVVWSARMVIHRNVGDLVS